MNKSRDFESFARIHVKNSVQICFADRYRRLAILSENK